MTFTNSSNLDPAMRRILFLCAGNSARSQMAEGLLRHEADGAYEVFSAGTTPSSLRQEAIAVMSEVGIDISDHWSKPVNDFICCCSILDGSAERVLFRYPRL